MFQKVLPLWIRLWSAILSVDDTSESSAHHVPSTDSKNGDNPPVIMIMINGKITLLTISQINKHLCLTTTLIQAKPAASLPKTWFYTTTQKIAQPEIMTHLHRPSHEIGIKNKPWPSLACSIPKLCTQVSTWKYSTHKKKKKRSFSLVRDLRERAIYKIILREWAALTS